MIKSMQDVFDLAKQGRHQRVAVVAAQEADVLDAIADAFQLGLITPILIGDPEAIRQLAAADHRDLSGITIIAAHQPEDCARIAVKMVRSHEADLIMKGNIATSTLLKAVLNKESGLHIGRLASHVGLFTVPTYHKPLLVTDAAINIAPDLATKIDIIANAVTVANALGIQTPKIAALAAVEKVNPGKMPCTEEAEQLTRLNQDGTISGCIIQGPLALDNAINREAAVTKGISGEVPGDADILLANDIETGNVLYKSLLYFAQAKGAGVVMGAHCPIILTSRADDSETKLASIALAAVIASHVIW